MNNLLGIDVNLWNNTEAKEQGEFDSLKLGGHEVKIVNAVLYENPTNGNKSLKVMVDIAGKDEQAGFFQKQYDSNNLSEKKWPNGATRYLSLKEESLAFTKGFTTSVEKSNAGFKFDTSKGWEQLRNLKVAGVFGQEEYERNDGSVGLATKLTGFRSLDKLNEIKVPKIKMLDGTFVEVDDYKNVAGNRQAAQLEKAYGCVEISTEQLPF